LRGLEFGESFQFLSGVCMVTGSRAAANPILLPKPKPRAMREHVVVPSIRGRDVACAQRSGVRYRVDAL
jgi:hypothetical protein